MRNRALLLLLLLSSFILLVGLAAAASGSADRPDPSDASPPAPSAITFTPVITHHLPLVAHDHRATYFFDDFSDPASGWAVDELHEASWGYAGGEYQIWLRDAGTWAVAPWPYGGAALAYTVEVEARHPPGGRSTYGIYFDFEDWQNFTIYYVDPNTREFAIFQRINDVWQPVVDRTASGWINHGAATNRLRLVRTPLQLTVYVNGRQLASITASSQPASSPVGLLSAADADGDISRFDNFKYWSGSLPAVVPDTSWSSSPPEAPSAVPDWLHVPPERPAGI